MNDPEMNEPMPDEANRSYATPMTPASPGSKLAAGREEHGWTIDQVAAYLKLAPRQVMALERDDYAALPGMPIVRGFVRSYAKLLKIDAVPLLAELGGERVLASESLKPKEGLATPFSEARLPSMSEKPTISSKWMIGLLLIVLLGAALWATRQGGTMFDLTPHESPRVQQSGPEDAAPEQAAPNAGPEAETSEAPVPAISVPVEEAPQPLEPTQAANGTPVSAVPAPPASEASSPAREVPATASDADVLTLTVREESWIEVRRAGGGGTLVARLAQPGERISLDVRGPVDLVVGNAAGVDASLRGEPVQLKGSTTSNVARITLK